MKKIVHAIILLFLFSSLSAQESENEYLPTPYHLGGKQIDGIRDISMSFDGKMIAYPGSFTDNVLIQDAETKETIKNIDCGVRVESVVFTENYLFVGLLHSKTILVYDIQSWEQVKSYELDGNVLELRYRNGFVAALLNGTGLAIIDVSDLGMKIIEEMNCGMGDRLIPKTEYNRDYYSKGPFAISEDGNFYATSVLNGPVTVYDRLNDRVISHDGFPFDATRMIAFSNDNKKLAIFAYALSFGQMLGIFDVETGDVLYKYQLPENYYSTHATSLLWTKDDSKVLIPLHSNEFYQVDLLNYTEERIHFADWEKATIKSMCRVGDKIYFADGSGFLSIMDINDPRTISHIYMGVYEEVQINPTNQENQLIGIDRDKEIAVLIHTDEEKVEVIKPSKEDCDGAVKTIYNKGKCISLFDLSKNIHIVDYEDRNFSNGKTIPINVLGIEQSYFKTFAITSDNRYMYIPDFKSNNLYWVDLVSGETKIVDAGGLCGNIAISSDDKNLYLMSGDNIQRFAINQGNLVADELYEDTNARYQMTTLDINPELTPLVVTDHYLFYFNTISTELVRINLNDKSTSTYQTFFIAANFALNASEDRALLLDINGAGMLFKIEDQFQKVNEWETGDVVTIQQVGFDEEKDVFYFCDYGNVTEVNPYNGSKNIVIDDYGLSKVYKKGAMHYYQTGLDKGHPLGYPQTWLMHYYDSERNPKTFEMHGHVKDFFADPINHMPVFLVTGSEYLVYFFEDYTLDVEEEPIISSVNKDILIYPNPSPGPVTIEIPGDYKKMELSVFNLLGIPVIQNTYTGLNSVKIKLNTPGIYIVKLRMDEKLITRKLIVK